MGYSSRLWRRRCFWARRPRLRLWYVLLPVCSTSSRFVVHESHLTGPLPERSLHSNHGLAMLESPEVHKDPKLDARRDGHGDEQYPPSIMPPVPRLAEDSPMSVASPTPTPSGGEGLLIPIS